MVLSPHFLFITTLWGMLGREMERELSKVMKQLNSVVDQAVFPLPSFVQHLSAVAP